MGKYNELPLEEFTEKQILRWIANELAESNRLKRLKLEKTTYSDYEVEDQVLWEYDDDE